MSERGGRAATEGVLERLRAHKRGEGPDVPLDEVLLAWGATEVSPMKLYGDVFHLGDHLIQADGEAPTVEHSKSNPIIIGNDGERMHRKILFEDTFEETLAEFADYDWSFVSGCTYFGRHNDAEHQGRLCALIIDLDGQDGECLHNLLSGAIDAGAYPVPNYLVLSGHNVHLYYVLEEPLSLYPNSKTQAKALKYALIDKIWNEYTSREKDRQHQGINQGFRVPGSRTKVEGVRARAFLLDHHPRSLDELNEFVPEESHVNTSRRWREPRMTLAQAREKFPDWYERVVVGHMPPGTWNCKEDLYTWWLRQIRSGSTYGHRYFCIMCLAIYAAKCGIYDRERVERDALSLVPFLNDLSPLHPFTEDDVTSALECLDARYKTFPRADIAKLSGIEIPANKRNTKAKRSREAHMRRVNRIISDDVRDGEPERRGRPRGSGTKAEMICLYADDHPSASHSEIARALGVSRTTVVKWLSESGRTESAATEIARLNAAGDTAGLIAIKMKSTGFTGIKELVWSAKQYLETGKTEYFSGKTIQAFPKDRPTNLLESNIIRDSIVSVLSDG